MEINKTQETLPVMEHFYTLQGEGFHQGSAAYFIRLAGCDVGCVWCDVKESWEAEKHPFFTIDQIVSFVQKAMPTGIVVITGGEPLMHNLTTLTNSLRSKGYRCHIETSGAHAMSGSWDWICVSPKKFKAPLPEVLQQANELKVVVFNQSDFDWAEKHIPHIPSSCNLFLQPEWDKKEKLHATIIDYIQKNAQWRLSLQVHKYLNIP